MIYFTSEIRGFDVKNKRQVKKWLEQIAQNELKKIDELNYIFVSDEALLEMNVQYLEHDTLTDIITFDNSDEGEVEIQGDIFISYDRVKENATIFQVSFEKELFRVIAHGLLHLCGFKDKTDSESQQMRKKENEAIELLTSFSISY